jgi:O-antigen/teichoic acid export membrane protein
MARDAESVFRHHWAAFFSGGVLSLTRLASGIIRIKYISLMLGTAGVGFLSQAGQIQILGITIGSLAMAVGIINRMGAIGPANRAREGRLLSTAFTSQLTVSGLLLGGAIVFSRQLSHLAFGVGPGTPLPVSSRDVLAVVFSVPLSVMASGYLEAVFFGGGRYDLYVRASVMATILGLIATLTIVEVWGLPGAFWSIFASSAFLLTAFLLYVRRVRPLTELFRFGFDWSEANALTRFSVAILVSGALVPAARLWVQSKVIHSFGIDANGLLAVPFSVTSYYTPFLTNALWGRMYPSITQVGAAPAARRELAAALRLTVVMATAAIAAILFLKDILVPLAYTRAFLPAARLLPAQLTGDYLYFVALPFTVYTLGIARLRVYLAAWVSYSIAAVAACIVLIPWLGLVAVPVGYGIANGIGAAVALAWFVARQDEGWLTTLAMIAAGLLAVAVQAYLAWSGTYVVIQGCVVVATSLAVFISLWKARA